MVHFRQVEITRQTITHVEQEAELADLAMGPVSESTMVRNLSALTNAPLQGSYDMRDMKFSKGAELA